LDDGTKLYAAPVLCRDGEKVLRLFVERQKRLDPEFEAAIYNNLDELYEVDKAPVPSAPDQLDAKLGRIAMRFVDRAGDTCPEDPAEKICAEFYAAMCAALDAQKGDGT
jgi:hypothetical protein